MKCEKCGAKNKRSLYYCQNCGTILPESEKENPSTDEKPIKEGRKDQINGIIIILTICAILSVIFFSKLVLVFPHEFGFELAVAFAVLTVYLFLYFLDAVYRIEYYKAETEKKPTIILRKMFVRIVIGIIKSGSSFLFIIVLIKLLFR